MKEEKIFFLKSPFSYFRYLKDYVIYGITPSEHNCLNFSKLNHHGKSDFITMRKNRLLDKLFNSVDANKILWDKALFNDYFSDYINHAYLPINKDTTELEIENFYKVTHNKGGYLVKPNSLFYGKGIYKHSTIDELKRIWNSGESYIVEEVVKNVDELSVLNDSSLNTLRVVTIIDRFGEVNIIAIILRTGSKGAIIDNFLGGGTCYHVDIKTGVVDSPGMCAKGNSYIEHPSSGYIMPGYRIPKFEEVKQYVIKLAKHLPKARYVGWDIAVTDNGVEVIEGNVSPSAELIQCNKRGLYKIIKSYY